MKLDIRYAEHPGDMKGYDTKTMREHFLFENVFIEDEINLGYTHSDRVVFGGAFPKTKALKLEGGKDFGSSVFLDRRELGVICIAGSGAVSADGAEYKMKKGDGLYIGKGVKDVIFTSDKMTPRNSTWQALPRIQPTLLFLFRLKKPIRANWEKRQR